MTRKKINFYGGSMNEYMHSIVILITVVSSFGLCAMDDQGDRKSLAAATADHAARSPATLSACMSVKNKLAQCPGIDKNLVRVLCIMKALPDDAQGMVFENLRCFRFRDKPFDGKSLNRQCRIKLISDELLACSFGRDIKILKVADGTCIQTLKGHGSDIKSFENGPGGKLISGANDGTIRIWDPIGGKCLKIFTSRDIPYCLKLMPNGNLVSGSATEVTLWDLSLGLVCSVHKCCNHLLLNNENLIVHGGYTDEFDQNLNFVRRHEEIQTNDYISCMNKTPDNRVVFGTGGVVDKSHNITIVGKNVQKLKGHTDTVQCLEFTSEGQLISGSDDKTIKIWDLKTGRCLQTLDHADKPVRQLQLASNGTLIALGIDQNGGMLYFWDMGPGIEEIAIREGMQKSSPSKVANLPASSHIPFSDNDLIRLCLKAMVENNGPAKKKIKLEGKGN